jgi:hypothetical protein
VLTIFALDQNFILSHTNKRAAQMRLFKTMVTNGKFVRKLAQKKLFMIMKYYCSTFIKNGIFNMLIPRIFKNIPVISGRGT